MILWNPSREENGIQALRTATESPTTEQVVKLWLSHGADAVKQRWPEFDIRSSLTGVRA